MKATIITFKRDVIDIPEYRPTIKMRVRHVGKESLIDHVGEFPKIGSLDQIEYKIYQSIVINDSGGKHFLYADYEESRNTVLILNEIIRQEVEEYEKREIDYKVKIAQQVDLIKYLEGLFVVKIYLWIRKKFK